MISDIDVPTNHVTGEVILEDGLPRFLYVMIRRSRQIKKDKVYSHTNHANLSRIMELCYRST